MPSMVWCTSPLDLASNVFDDMCFGAVISKNNGFLWTACFHMFWCWKKRQRRIPMKAVNHTYPQFSLKMTWKGLDLLKIHIFTHLGLWQSTLNDWTKISGQSEICVYLHLLSKHSKHSNSSTHALTKKHLWTSPKTLRKIQASNQSQSIKTPRSSSLCWKWSLTSNNMLSSLEVNPPLVM